MPLFGRKTPPPEDHWYEIRPYMAPQFKDNYSLFGPPHNFVYVLSVDEIQGMKMFMRVPGDMPSTNEYQAIRETEYLGTANDAYRNTPCKFYKYFFRLKTAGVYPTTLDVIRDRVYNEMNHPEMMNTTFIVVGQRIFHHMAVDNEMNRRSKQTLNVRYSGQESRRVLLNNMKKEAKYLCQIFVTSDNMWAARNLRDNAFPSEHTPWEIKGASEAKIMKYLKPDYKLSSYPKFDRLGIFLNGYVGTSTMRDTVLSKTGLECLVQLPLNRLTFPLPQGETATGRSQNMAMMAEDQEYVAATTPSRSIEEDDDGDNLAEE